MLVDVSPDMGMYRLLIRQGYDPSYALAEFIDNALDAHLKAKNHKKLTVELKFYSDAHQDPTLRNSIVIKDDGTGIDAARLKEALKPVRVGGGGGLSEFGIGMKAAAVWFADVWTLHTVPHNGKKSFTAIFDLQRLLSENATSIDVTDKPRGTSKGGTTITLLKLRRGLTKDIRDQIFSDLREFYQRYTEGAAAILDLYAEFDGTIYDLKYEAPARAVLYQPVAEKRGKDFYLVGNSREWLVPLAFVFEGKRVDGFISLLETGSYKTNPGIVLFRHNRVITGTTREAFIPPNLVGTSNKYGRQRVYGELNLDGLPVAYTKDRFEIDLDAFVVCIKQQPGVELLLQQAEKYRPNATKISATKFEKLNVGTKPAKGKKSPTQTPPEPQPDDKGGKGSAPSKPAPPDVGSVLSDVRIKCESLALSNILGEAVLQWNRRRPIAVALLLRIILEAGIHEKIRTKFPLQSTKVSGKALKALVNHMQSNQPQFFTKADEKVVKCLGENRIAGKGDVMMLNDISHGNYQPSLDEVSLIVSNMEPLLWWAYSP